MNFGANYLGELKKAGFDGGEYTEGFFMGCFSELLNDPAYSSYTTENGIDRKALCAALAQLKTGRYMGFSADRPFDIKGFWGLTDSEVYAVAAACPQRLLGFLIMGYQASETPDEDMLAWLDKLYRERKAMDNNNNG